MDIKKLRWFIKQLEGEFFNISTTCQLLGLDLESSVKYLSQLEHLGYIQKTQIENHWVVSIRGKVLAQTKNKRLFKVESMKKGLSDFLERVEYVNKSNKYTSKINTVVITSQFPILQSSEGIRIKYDLAKLELKTDEKERRERRLRSTRNRVFDNYTQSIFYPETAIQVFLKSRSHIIKLERIYSDEINGLSGFRVYDSGERKDI